MSADIEYNSTGTFHFIGAFKWGCGYRVHKKRPYEYPLQSSSRCRKVELTESSEFMSYDVFADVFQKWWSPRWPIQDQK